MVKVHPSDYYAWLAESLSDRGKAGQRLSGLIKLDCIEFFYNPKRHHGYAGGLAPVEFENQYFKRLKSVY